MAIGQGYLLNIIILYFSTLRDIFLSEKSGIWRREGG